MGRAMLIISAGAVIALGILQIGIQSQRKSIAQSSAASAYEAQIRNKAFTAAQLAMERINESGGAWHPTQNSPWIEDIDGDSISLYYKLYPSSATGTFSMLEGDTVEIHSRSWYNDPVNGTFRELDIVTSYVKTSMHFVPEFESAMSFAVDSDDFSFSASGNALISGNDASGTCPSKPAVTVRDEDSAENIIGADNLYEYFTGGDNSKHFESDSGAVSLDSDLSYEPVDDLVARLAQMTGVVKLPNGVYGGSLGSADNPGVFFVEDETKFTGKTPEGYGIMVIRNDGSFEDTNTDTTYNADGELEIKGNFKFNGLVIFENAYKLEAAGTPRINGSVLVGKPNNLAQDLDINLNGTIDIQYDCTAEKYAQLASATMLKQNRYKRLSTYE